MKAIETTATLTENGQLTLDEPLTLAHNSRIRVIVLVSEEEDPNGTPIEEIRKGMYRGWQDALTGRTKPISQLWEGLDVDTKTRTELAIALFQQNKLLIEQAAQLIAIDVDDFYQILVDRNILTPPADPDDDPEELILAHLRISLQQAQEGKTIPVKAL